MGIDKSLGDFLSAEILDEYLPNGSQPALDYGYFVFGQVIESRTCVVSLVKSACIIKTDRKRYFYET